MEVNLSELEEKYGPFEGYGGVEVFVDYINEYIPEEYREVWDLNFKLELFKKSFIRYEGNCKDSSSRSISVSLTITERKYNNLITVLRTGGQVSIFWGFVRPKEILQWKIEEVKDTPSKSYEWLSFLFAKYNEWDGKYSLDEVVEYYNHKECVEEHMTIEEILNMMDENLSKRYFSIRDCMEKNFDRIRPSKILDMFDEYDLEEMFYENFGDKEDLIYGDHNTVLTFKKIKTLCVIHSKTLWGTTTVRNQL